MGILLLSSAPLAFAASETNVHALERLAERFRQELEARKTDLYYELLHSTDPATAALNADPDVELAFIGPRGKPFYYGIDNEDAAETISTDRVWPSGGEGYSLEGAGTMTGNLGLWDSGSVRASHQEFGGRITQADSPDDMSSHSTHVAGTLIAAGVESGAKGMSPAAELECYDWSNDESEMASAAAGGMWLSNHSYGFKTGWYSGSSNDYWYGDISISTEEDYGFGFYSDHAQEWDQIAHYAPYYLICKSAGNHRNDYGDGGHYHWDGDWVWSNDDHPDDGGVLGYDTIAWNAAAKNILTVGAVDDIPGGYSSPDGVIIRSSSGWGPTDDGRIKPDVVANGTGLYSADEDSNSDYTTKSGTSMSAPNACGSANLFVNYYRSTHGLTTPRSATTKALLIHTADECGSDPGPDYEFGWGLVNTLSAVRLIDDDAADPGAIHEATLSNGATDTYYFIQDSPGPARFTTVWTDPPGTPPADSLDPPDLMLVNDLDLRLTHISSGLTYEPWVLDPYSPSAAATTGDNIRDNVEQVHTASLPAGVYAVTITHKGSIGSGQDYSLIASTPLVLTLTSAAGAEHSVNPDDGVRQVVYPNPFVSSTSISFLLPEPARVTADVFDLAGRHVRTLANGMLGSGANHFVWDARNDKGQALSSGAYFTLLTVDGERTVEKVILLRGSR